MVFNNIFANSIKHNGNNVQINVSVKRDEEFVIIEISDDGPGVSDSIRENLFQRGISTSGGGLGLYLSRRIVESLNGSIAYVHEKNKGAKFRICLPLDNQ
jgi:signal transduction histidine kinase